MKHGTPAGETRHRRAGEPPCAACLEARRIYQRHRYWRRKYGVDPPPLHKTPELVEDYLRTYGPATMGALHARITDRHPDVQLDAVRQAVYRLRRDGIVDATTGTGHDSLGRTARIHLYHVTD